jgi:hypothetical protein
MTGEHLARMIRLALEETCRGDGSSGRTGRAARATLFRLADETAEHADTPEADREPLRELVADAWE